ncbi:hypothetical protein ATANTOWER_009421 [Ataeniobius toweri]|uniref:Ig-like domain-containing protein n=1 Tax=Ataeniobius toweri TaxID=208326 RepID=A0ABU7BGN0_9TELE|nr:hypothetical protein [Ataeniobius toweri]
MVDYLKVKISSLKKLNQREAVQILQIITGCEWDEKTAYAVSFLQFGYDGEDFIKIDPMNFTWIPQSSQAVIIKEEWEAEESPYHSKRNKDFLNSICPEWLKKYAAYGQNLLQSTVLPSVSLLQKTPSSLVTCHATGFFPNRGELFWRKDGEEVQEGTSKGEILPNNDGTFQMNVDLNISSVTPEDWKRYNCVFHISGVKDDVLTRLDKALITTNWGKTENSENKEKVSNVTIGISVGVVVVVIAAAAGIAVCKKMKNKSQTSSPETVPELSERLNQETTETTVTLTE